MQMIVYFTYSPTQKDQKKKKKAMGRPIRIMVVRNELMNNITDN